MALPTPSGFDIAVLTFNSISMEDHTVEGTIAFTTNNTSVATWGGVVTIAGSPSGSGTYNVVLDETASSPHLTLEAEYFAQTAGGVASIVEPKGTATGNRRYAYNSVITDFEFGGAGGDVQQASYPFITSGAITPTTQS